MITSDKIKKKLTAKVINAKLYFISRMPKAEQKEALEQLSKELNDSIYDLNEPIQCFPIYNNGYQHPIVCTSLLSRWCSEGTKRREFVLFLKEKGADFNHVNKPGFSVLEICLNSTVPTYDDTFTFDHISLLSLFCSGDFDINLPCRSERLMKDSYVKFEQLPETITALECYTTYPYQFKKTYGVKDERNKIIKLFLKSGAIVTPRAFANLFDTAIPERYMLEREFQREGFSGENGDFLYADIHREIANKIRNELFLTGAPANIRTLEREVVRLFSSVRSGYDIKQKIFKMFLYSEVIVRTLKEYDRCIRIALGLQTLSDVGIHDSIVQVILQYAHPKHDVSMSKDNFFFEDYLDSAWNAMIKSSQLVARSGKTHSFRMWNSAIGDILDRDITLTCGYEPDEVDVGKEPRECVWLFSGSYLKDVNKEKSDLERILKDVDREKRELERMADMYPRPSS